jgi:hypothetical protein
VLLIPFAIMLQGVLGRLNWVEMVWRPVAAGGAMLTAMAVIWPLNPALAVVGGCALYPALLFVFKPLDAEERAMVAPLLPGRFRRLVHSTADMANT